MPSKGEKDQTQNPSRYSMQMRQGSNVGPKIQRYSCNEEGISTETRSQNHSFQKVNNKQQII